MSNFIAHKFEHNVFEQFFDFHHNQFTPTSSSNSSRQTSYDQMSINNDRGSSPDSSISGDPIAPHRTLGAGIKKSPDARRVQNRKAQRAFRARQKQHVGSLEQKLQSVLSDYEELQQKHAKLLGDYQSLLHKEEISSPVDDFLAFTQGWKQGMNHGGVQDGIFEDFLLSEESLKWNSL